MKLLKNQLFDFLKFFLTKIRQPNGHKFLEQKFQKLQQLKPQPLPENSPEGPEIRKSVGRKLKSNSKQKRL